MQLDIRKPNIDWSHALASYTEERLLERLETVQRHIQRVTVWMSDVNGPRGGDDKQVAVSLHLASGGVIRAEERSSCLYQAIDAAARRARQSVRDQVDRRRSSRRRRSQAA